MSAPTIVVVAGGTGGHVYPALAVADRLRGAGARVVWVGTERGLEARVVPRAGIELRCVHMVGLRGKGIGRWLQAPARLLLALAESLALMVRIWPQAVLGMGGYVAAPAGVAAWLLRRPLLIHEQNALPGLTNRILGRLAAQVMEAFPGSFSAAYGALHTGNPVREAIACLAPPGERLHGRTGALRLLVLGGSQGARVLNETLPKVLAALPDRTQVTVRHQTGTQELEATRARYQQVSAGVEVLPFIEDMAEALEWADLVVCRAGAMTIAELAAAGAASVLIPYPYAVDDHQTHNGRYLADAGAAVLLPETDLDVQGLARLLSDLAAAPARLLAMSQAARNRALPEASARVADRCLEFARA